MRLSRRPVGPVLRTTAFCVGVLALAACAERWVQGPVGVTAHDPAANALTTLECTATVKTGVVSCRTPSASTGGAHGDFVGGQNVYTKLTSSNVSYNGGTEIFQFDVTVQNLMKEAIGTPDGTIPGVNGIRVFFANGPTATSGTGTITVANADGTGTFTGINQPYFQYNNILAQNAVSPVKTWQLNVPSTVNTFAFTVYLYTDIQPLIVINELLANPGGTISDANGEWVELYNAGTRQVNLQGFFIADSAASGRRPYAMINDTLSSLVIQPGGYFVIGNTKNTTNNGGVPVDYAYGATMAFANSLDAFKLARVYGTDTLTIDRTQYASAAISAQNGISRELKNALLDNSNMDGSNWVDASVSSVYGPGGRGTPKAQNSGFTP
ncbi:MAG: Por secretion system C-terminal sorting protein [Gemmatimonadetes bacterium]|nr:Por secretion system C-terminal sorting protein [Gemmatimonadota bacterium]